MCTCLLWYFYKFYSVELEENGKDQEIRSCQRGNVYIHMKQVQVAFFKYVIFIVIFVHFNSQRNLCKKKLAFEIDKNVILVMEYFFQFKKLYYDYPLCVFSIKVWSHDPNNVCETTSCKRKQSASSAERSVMLLFQESLWQYYNYEKK